LSRYVDPLTKAFVRLQQATGQIARAGLKRPEEAGAAATEYLRLFGFVALAYQWARMAEVSLGKLGEKIGEDDFYRAKLATGAYFMDKVLPQTGALFASIMAGGATMIDFPEAAF
jgi:butyryl-CoA dehydrogenase